jgi:uncharacterized lipoprotein YbaY
MAVRVPQIARWIVLILVLLPVVLVLLAFTPPVQHLLLGRALRIANANLSGRLSARHVRLTPGGRLLLTDVSLADEQGTVLSLDTLTAQVSFRALLHDSIHVRRLTVHGLALDLRMDSSGSNLQRALQTSKRKELRPNTSRWRKVVLLDTVEVTGRHARIEQNGRLWFASDHWSLSAKAAFADDTARYRLQFADASRLRVETDGELVVGKQVSPVNGVVKIEADSSFTRTLPPPAAAVGDVHLSAEYAVRADSLSINGSLHSSAAGFVSADVVLPFPLREPSGRGTIAFNYLTPNPFLPDSVAKIVLNGTLVFSKGRGRHPLNGLKLDLRLNDCRFDDYPAFSAWLHAHAPDSNAVEGEGKIETAFGNMALRFAASQPALNVVRGDLSAAFTRLDLRRLHAAVPDTLELLSGRMDVEFAKGPANHLRLHATAELDTIRLGRLCIDRLTADAAVNDDSLELKTLTARLVGAVVQAQAQGLRKGLLRFAVTADAPDLHRTCQALAPLAALPDTLFGSLKTDLQGTASLAGDSLSQATVSGSFQLTDASLGRDSVRQVSVQLHHANLDSLWMDADLTVLGLHVAGRSIDSLWLSARGTPQQIAAELRVNALGDTLRLATAFDAARSGNRVDVCVRSFNAEAYGVRWQTEGESNLSVGNRRIDLDGVTLSSPMGTVRASGTFQRGGEEDLTLELSALNTGDIARLFKLRLPESVVNARLQLSGPDTALTGEISVRADSVRLNGESLMDEAVFHATIDARHTQLDGFLIWFGDTLSVFEGDLPARLTLDKGFAIADSLPIRGRTRLNRQRLDKANRFLPFGTALDGWIAGDVLFSGTVTKPLWSGQFSIRDGDYRDLRYGVHYRRINVEAGLAADTLNISRFDAVSGGTLTGSGWAVMAFPLPSDLHLNLSFDRFDFLASGTVQARASGQASVNGPPNRLRADGHIELTQALYRITQATGKQIEEVDLKAELARLRGDTTQAPFLLSRLYRTMSHEIRIEIPGNCWLRGSGLNIELIGSLWLYKDPLADPTVNGEIKVRQGSLQVLGRELRIDEGQGVVRFEGPIDDPYLDITARLPRPPAEVKEITAHVSGNLRSSQIELKGTRSDGSEMNPEDVVMALVGSGINLFHSDSVTVSGKLEGMLTSAATSQLSGLVGRWAGLDVFQFRPGKGGLSDLSSGTLEVGTYVTDRLFVRVLQPVQTIQTGQEVSIEYRLLDWLKLRAQQTGKQSSGFDVFVQVDWR